MPWTTDQIDEYRVVYVAEESPGYPRTVAYIELIWDSQRRATLWFNKPGDVPNLPNSEFSANDGSPRYYARFRYESLRGIVDTLRNEKPVFFRFNNTSNTAFVTTGAEPVGEEEQIEPT